MRLKKLMPFIHQRITNGCNLVDALANTDGAYITASHLIRTELKVHFVMQHKALASVD
jgi:hypothetical protein